MLKKKNSPLSSALTLLRLLSHVLAFSNYAQLVSGCLLLLLTVIEGLNN